MPTLEEAKAAMKRLEDYMHKTYIDWRAEDCPNKHIIRDVITLKAFIETLKSQADLETPGGACGRTKHENGETSGIWVRRKVSAG